MEDHEGIRQTLAEYCLLVDDGRFDEFADLFEIDGALRPFGDAFEGREAIRAFIAGTQRDPASRGTHTCTNIVMAVEGDTARARSSFLVVGPDHAVRSAGRYDDILRRGGDRWHFVERVISRPGSGVV